jgi:hypothetical protein
MASSKQLNRKLILFILCLVFHASALPNSGKQLTQAARVVQTGLVPTSTKVLRHLDGALTRSSTFDQLEIERLRTLGIVICPGPEKASLRLIRGLLICQPVHNVSIWTKFGKVSIQRQSIVQIMLNANCLSIQSLHQPNLSAVTWSDQISNFISLRPGKELILAPTSFKTFTYLPPAFQVVNHLRISQVPLNKDRQVFYADFSIPSALTTVTPLKELFLSDKHADKVAIDKILKTSVILSELDSSLEHFDR